MTATPEALAEWAQSRSLHRVSSDVNAATLLGTPFAIRRLTINGAVAVEFRDRPPSITVEWNGTRADFWRGLPLAALTGLIAGLLGPATEAERDERDRTLPTWSEIADGAVEHLHAARNEVSGALDWLRAIDSPLTANQASAAREARALCADVKDRIDQAKDVLHA